MKTRILNFFRRLTGLRRAVRAERFALCRAIAACAGTTRSASSRRARLATTPGRDGSRESSAGIATGFRLTRIEVMMSNRQVDVAGLRDRRGYRSPRRRRLHHALPGLAADGLRHRRVFLAGLAVGAQFDRDQLRGEQRVRPTRSSGSRSPRASIPGSGVLLAIDSVLETSITLRRLHKDLNVGQPPAPAAGLPNVTFTINTLDPQTEEASFDIKRRFGIDENIVDRTSCVDLRPARPSHGDRALGACWHAIPRRRAATRGTSRASSTRSRSSSTRSSTACRFAGGRTGPRSRRPGRCRGELHDKPIEGSPAVVAARREP